MQKTFLSLSRRLGCALGLTLTVPAMAGLQYPYVAWCTSTQEVPAFFNTDAIGGGTFLIDVTNNTLTYYIVRGDLSGTETLATIDGPADPGVLGVASVHTLPLGNRKVGVWNFPEALQADLLAGRFYLQIRSSAFPAGELRGQIVSHVATLDGDQVVPPSATSAGGIGLFVMNPATKTLSYHLSIYNLCSFETGCGIFGNAPHQTNGTQLVTLPNGANISGSWTYLDQTALDDGLLYINVKTICFPGGELRGQITRYVSPLDSSQEVPAGSSSAVGVGFYSLQSSTATVGMHLLRSNLVGTETTVTYNGYAARGATAGILYTLPASDDAFRLGSYVYGAVNESKIRGGLTYANFRSTSALTGEIRGQFEPAQRFCVGDLNGDRVVDLSDMSAVLAHFGANGVGPESGDVTGDGVVDLQDLSAILSRFGAACP